MPDKDKESLQKLMNTLEEAFPKLPPEGYGRIIGYGEAIIDLAPGRKDPEEKKKEKAAVTV
ncbi:MAG: hypothetical protein IKE02_04550 [Lachnospiraceae bacterium]|nr:hypothetical protein [Lachnospiraceae bacterium]